MRGAGERDSVSRGRKENIGIREKREEERCRTANVKEKERKKKEEKKTKKGEENWDELDWWWGGGGG